jgi:pyrroline-5-carboxylate reductase
MMHIAPALASLSSLVLVGCGKMGGAMLEGWLRAGLPAGAVSVIDPSPPAEVRALIERAGVSTRRPTAPPRVLLIAVKPQIMDGVLETITDLAGPDTLILSVVAGKTMARFEAQFGALARVVRTIPNTPAAVGRGVTGCVANAAASDDDRALAQALLEAVGRVVWVEDEAQIDAITAVSGSGPAYVFHMVEALAKAGVAAGLPEATALSLARATVEGAGELLFQASDIGADQLRKNVTSPNGTTQAALDVLMDQDSGLAPLMTRAVSAAARRSRELAG